MSRLFTLLVATDVWLNQLAGGRADETISARAATAQRDGKRWGCALCRVLDWLKRDHCANAITNDVNRARAAVRDLEGT